MPEQVDQEKQAANDKLDVIFLGCQLRILKSVSDVDAYESLTQQLNTLLGKTLEDDAKGRDVGIGYLIAVQECLIKFTGAAIAANSVALVRNIPKHLLEGVDEKELVLKILDRSVETDNKALRSHAINVLGDIQT